jgi:ABC-type transport system substrate-binding protein
VDLTYLFGLNYNRPAANFPKFRKALDLAIDRQAIAAVYGDQIALSELIQPRFIKQPVTEQDITQARELIDEIREQLPQPIVIRMRNVDENPYHKAIAEIVVNNLADLNLATKIVTSIPKSGHAWDEQDHDLRLMWLGLGNIVDPLSQFSLYLRSTPYPDMRLPSEYDLTPEYELARQKGGLNERIDAALKVSKKFREHSLAIPLYGKKSSVWIRKGLSIDLGAQRTALLFWLDRVKM